MDETEPPKPPRRRKPPAVPAGAATPGASELPRTRTRRTPAGGDVDTKAAPEAPGATAQRAASRPRTRKPQPESMQASATESHGVRATGSARDETVGAQPIPSESAMVPSFARRPLPAAPRAAPARPADSSTRSLRAIDWLLDYLPPAHRVRMREYLVLMRMDRPVGALLLLWPTWWALWFAANDFPPLGPLVIFTLGVFVMRSAGCVINDYADHGWLDANVERTRGRPMAAGRVSRKEALLLFGGLLLFAFVLVLFTNALTIKLSFVGAALAAVYPFSKRVTHLAQVVLGAAFGWSIPMAFAAVTNSLPPLCWLLFLANVLFSVVYDTEYAMVDRDEDLRVGAKSTAILFGDADRVIIGVLMATFLLAMLLAGSRAMLHWPYFVALAIAAGLFGWQQWLIRERAREACFAAFRNNNLVGLVLWLGLLFALAIR